MLMTLSQIFPLSMVLRRRAEEIDLLENILLSITHQSKAEEGYF